MVAEPQFDYDVFISFASADQELVRPIWQALTSGSLRVFWSDATLRDRVGTSWFEIIQESLERSRHLLLIATPASLASTWVRREYKAFFSQCYKPPSRLLVPVLAGTRVDELPMFLREVEACSYYEPDLPKRLVRIFGGVDVAAMQARLAKLEEAASDLTEKQIDKIARRVVEMISDQVVRNIAWEVVPDLAETVIKERLRQFEEES